MGAALEARADVQRAFGGAEAVQSLRCIGRPTEVLLLAAVRTFKSQLAAAVAIVASQTIDLSDRKPGEVPRYAIISLTIDHAKATYDHARGMLQSSPLLTSLTDTEPGNYSIVLKTPQGRPAEIKIVALSAAGSAVVSRWLLGVCFDEAPRISVDGVRNLVETRHNAMGRLLPGAQVLTIGSPWAPVGPIPDQVREFHGHPSKQLVVIRGRGPDLNPKWWTPERCEELRVNKPEVYRTEVEAEFLDPEEALISSIQLDAVTRAAPKDLPFEAGHEYIAAMDPGVKGNAWALVVVTRERSGQRRVVLCRQWRGSKVNPLSPAEVLREVKGTLKPYGITDVYTDQWSSEAIRDLGAARELNVIAYAWTAARRVELFEQLRIAIAEKQLEVCPDQQLRADLLSVRKRVTQSGMTIDLPKTADGRHCDYAAAMALSMWQPLELPSEPEMSVDDEPPEARMPRRRTVQEAFEESLGY